VRQLAHDPLALPNLYVMPIDQQLGQLKSLVVTVTLKVMLPDDLPIRINQVRPIFRHNAVPTRASSTLLSDRRPAHRDLLEHI
jgi:hypothetical protein